jgi:uncharacterized protein
MLKHLVLPAFLLCFLLILPVRAADVPYLTGRIVDDAEILSEGARKSLDATLKAHEDRTSNQVVVLTVPSLEGESVEQFATRVFETWKLGQKAKDNGVLLVIAAKDRRLRIEVGYGLEGTLTDVDASRIVRNVITPRFKDQDYDGGVTAGVDAIVGKLEGRENPAMLVAASAPAKAASNDFLDVAPMPWVQRILFGAFIFSILGIFTLAGVFTPGLGWFLYFFLIPFWSMFPIVIIGGRATLGLLAIYLIGFPVAKLIVKRQAWYGKAAKDLRTTGRASVGGFVFSSGGGSSGSSSSSGSSFSGGGGSSGGGGASGSW